MTFRNFLGMICLSISASTGTLGCGVQGKGDDASSRFAQEVLPVVLGEETSWALKRVQCQGRRIEKISDEVLHLDCPQYGLPSVPAEKGHFEVWFHKNRVAEAKWEQVRSDIPVQQVLQLDEKIRGLSLSEIFSNRDLESEFWPEAIQRGEWHHRWSLGKEYQVVSYFGRMNGVSHWVLRLSEEGPV